MCWFKQQKWKLYMDRDQQGKPSGGRTRVQ